MDQKVWNNTSGNGRPMFTLMLLAFLNLISMTDRYLIPAVQPLIQSEFHVSNAAIGALSSAFFIVFMVSMPVAAFMGGKLRRKVTICGAVLIWTTFTLFTALSQTYMTVLINHALFAVGEAFFAIFGPVVIAEIYPGPERHKALVVFALTVPLGMASAFVIGSAAGGHGWRFPLECMAAVGGTAVIVTALLMKETKHATEAHVRSTQKIQIRPLLSNKLYIPTVIGGVCLAFSMVGLAVWLPTFLTRSTGLSLAHVNRMLGEVTVITGVLGVAAGGLLADRWLLRHPGALYLVSAMSMLGGVVAGTVVLYGPSSLAFAAVAVAQFFLFLNTAPMGAAILNSVSSRVLPVALGLSMFVGHAAGDGISPTLIGWIADHDSLRSGMEIALLPLILGAISLIGGASAMKKRMGMESGSL